MSRDTKRSPRSARLPASIRRFTLCDAPDHLLRRCHQRSEELFTEAIGHDGPTRQQIALLVTVCQNPGLSQAELVSRTSIDKNTLSQMVKRLTQRGLLKRRRARHDARANAIDATPEAVALLAEVMPRVRRVQKQLVEPLPQELRPVFMHCLRIIGTRE
ncbi:MarR family winged helix-turn-helix transcriptional regulator [Haliangium ochraceum]|uniref:Transcriptional regulator, MarR family n=1 Tax=Haliangium ochraceum (strain DSM 14365 / JCM 11303 / SMP-2) TaxID=502025 RepID=D0LSE3_HALO1|nr:MarR family transcriptional regulator [Haliangium ochraceum]ACY15642.1 transcriptional regulator, MarR family [Haliangium ochraceum DSM 14365]